MEVEQTLLYCREGEGDRQEEGSGGGVVLGGGGGGGGPSELI